MGFRPLQATKTVVVGTGGADRLALDQSVGMANVVRIFNSHATAVVFFAFGDVTVTCDMAAGGHPIGPLQSIEASPLPGQTHVAFDSAAGGITVYTTEGNAN